MSRTWLVILAGACGCIMLGSAVMAQGEPTFNVTSYIPERFIDLQWQIGGNVNLNGTRQRVTSVNLSGLSDDDKQVINLLSTSEYRFRTISRFLSWQVDAGLDLAHISNRHTIGNGSIETTSKSRFSPSIDQIIEAGQYVVSDLFVSAALETNWRYVNDPYEYVYAEIAPLSGDDVADVSPTADEAVDPRPGDWKEYRVTASIMPGWGRIYEGQYAATAMYMVDELKRNGLLKREPTFEEMRSLTETIYQYRLKHAVDARLHKIEALSKVMDILTGLGVIDDEGPHGYLFIQDVWDYFPRDDRWFGYQIRGGGGLEYHYNSDQLRYHGYSDYYRHRTSEERRPFASVAVDYCRPFGLRWQLDLSGAGRYYFDPSNTTTETSIDYRNYFYSVYEEHGIKYKADYDYSIVGAMQYIFDSRTRAWLSFSYITSHFHSESHDRSEVGNHNAGDDVMTENQLNRTAVVTAAIEYRISIPTTLQVNLGWKYDKMDSDQGRRLLYPFTTHTGYYYLTMTLVHSLY